ncbi:MAG TPA: hypothetical protein VFF64_20885 [Candidatus Eremiobacteraceae bacterium]|nr:hypothetical protein [Candidatus Eremiobacteraceae bacterium]
MTPIDPDTEKNKAEWRLFELRYKNLLSITKAQKVHLTTLLIEMTLLWTWFLSGSKDLSVQGVSLSAEGVWLVAPAVLTFFTLVLIGSINAALPANHQLQEIAERTIRISLPSDVAFYDLDTDKNVLDYLTFLKLSATDNRFDLHSSHSIEHFLYPAVLLLSIGTTWFALFHNPRTFWVIIYSMTCVVAQLSFVRRPLYRAWHRFRGDRPVDEVPPSAGNSEE